MGINSASPKYLTILSEFSSPIDKHGNISLNPEGFIYTQEWLPPQVMVKTVNAWFSDTIKRFWYK